MSNSSTPLITTGGKEMESRLQVLAQMVLDEAARLGASQAEVAVQDSAGLSINVRNSEVETVEHHHDKSLSVTTYDGKSTGSASSSDFSEQSVRQTVQAAFTIARHTADDDANGLADPNRMATQFPDLDLYHPWHISTDRLIELATACEASGLEFDERIVNTEGASVSTGAGLSLYANSHGFHGTHRASRHSLVCSVIGESENGMQRDYWYTSMRDPSELQSAQAVGEIAGERTIARLDATQLDTVRCPVLYEAPVASSLLGHLISAIGGTAQYRKSSFLLDMIDQQIFPEHIRIHEQPHLPKAAGSSAFDSEGVATEARDIISAGVLKNYVMSSYAARKLGRETTGNAGGVRNLTIDSGSLDRDGLLKKMGTGLFVTGLIGSGINGVTGDYSRGASGFWVEDGELVRPVDEITIAGNLKNMFMDIVEVGTDVDSRGNTRTGSILIREMTVGGS